MRKAVFSLLSLAMFAASIAACTPSADRSPPVTPREINVR